MQCKFAMTLCEERLHVKATCKLQLTFINDPNFVHSNNGVLEGLQLS